MLRNYNRTKEEEHKLNLSFITLIVGIINLSLMGLVLQGAYSLHSPMEFVVTCIVLSMGWYCYIGYKFVKSLCRKEGKLMTNKDKDIINTIKHYRKVLEQSKDKTESLMNMAKFSGLMTGLDLVLGKERSQELYDFATTLEKQVN